MATKRKYHQISGAVKKGAKSANSRYRKYRRNPYNRDSLKSAPHFQRSKRLKLYRPTKGYNIKNSIQSGAYSTSYVNKTYIPKGKVKKKFKLQKLICPPSYYRFTVGGTYQHQVGGTQDTNIWMQNDNPSIQYLLAEAEKLYQTGNATTGTAHTHELAAFNSTYETLLDNYTFKLTIKNVTNIPIHLTFRDIIANRDQTDTQTPLQLWANGLQDEDFASAIADGITQVGAKPTESKNFCINWHIFKTTKVQLSPGAEHTHIFNYNMNKYMQGWYELQSATDYWRKITTACLVTSYGSLVHTKTNDVHADATTGAVEYDWMKEELWKYRSYIGSNTHYSRFNGLVAPQIAAQFTTTVDAPAVDATPAG